MTKRIIAIMSLEAPETHDFEYAVNTIAANEFINSYFDRVDVKDFILENIRASKLSKEFEDAFVARDYSQCVALSDKKTFNKVLETMFAGIYKDFYELLKEYPSDIVFVQSYAGATPDWATHVVGWITPFDPSHIIEHEGVDEEDAKIIHDSYAKLLRSKKKNFNKLFDGSPMQDVVDYIKTL